MTMIVTPRTGPTMCQAGAPSMRIASAAPVATPSADLTSDRRLSSRFAASIS
jgi:hypothetical protein